MYKEGIKNTAQQYFCVKHLEFGVRSDYIEDGLGLCIDRIKVLEFAISYVVRRLAAGGDDEEDAKELQINAAYDERELELLNEYSQYLVLMIRELFDEFERLECDDCWNIQGAAALAAVEEFEASLD